MTSAHMTPEQDAMLAQSLVDRRVSRGERQSLARIASASSAEGRASILRRAIELAVDALSDPADRAVLDWLEDIASAARDRAGEVPGERDRAEAHFSPGDGCPRAILRLLEGAGRSIDACVFTITDDRLADALVAAHRCGVAVRVVTDDSKAEDLGSDAERLASTGVAVRVDRSPFHMHHKFAIVDGTTLLTGSYNWTRGAARDNEENLIISGDPRLVSPFSATFDRLWARFA